MQGLNVSWIDLLVAGVIVVSTILAVARGFVRETLSILAWAAAAFATLYFGPTAAAFLRLHISMPLAGPLIAYVGTFLVVLIPLSFVSYRLSLRVRESPVGALDRSLGVPFGILRGLALVGIAYLAFSLAIPVGAQPSWMTSARLLPLIQRSSDVLVSLLPLGEHAASAPTGQSRSEDAPIPRPLPRIVHGAGHPSQKSYQVEDRRALDRLIDASGASGNGKQ